jgi:pteridine reductase
MNLSGKAFLITGGRRVGRALAQLLADRGAAVALTYHTSREAIGQAVAAIAARGGMALAVAADLSRADEAEHAVAAAVAAFGRIDGLVNMASIYRRTPFATLTPGDFDAMMAANLAPAYHTSVAAARRMLEQPGEDGIRGKIVNIGDWATERPYKDYLPYLVAKGALKTLTMALARELAPHVTVNLVQPAMIAPPPDLGAADRDAVVAATPLRRVGTPDDVNRLILYLLEGTDFATGACFRVDGGRFLGADDVET